MDFSIRFATVADATAMLEIYAHSVNTGTASWEFVPPTLAEFTQRIVDKQAHGFPWILACDGDTVLGYAYASNYAERAGYTWVAEPTIYMAQEMQGKGVSKPLYEALIALLQAQGFYSLMARITHPNPASEAFHAKLGFVSDGCLQQIGWKNGTWMGLALMRLQLREPTGTPAPIIPVQALGADFVAGVLQRK